MSVMITLLFDVFILPLYRLVDYFIPKRDDYWGFTVHHIKSELFIENARALFEKVKSDGRIKKIIFIREGNPDFGIIGAKNVKLVQLKSIMGLFYLARCKVVLVTHSIAMDYSFRWSAGKFSVVKLSLRKHLVINLWHGKSIKKLYSLSNERVRSRLDRVNYRKTERNYYKGLITTARIDSYAMTAMFHPIKYENVWVTGYPQNDFLMMDEDSLPNYLRSEIDYISSLKSGKKLITYAPTYRQTTAVADAEYYQFSAAEMNELKGILKKHNAIFGFRFHYFRNSANYFNLEEFVDNVFIFDLGHENISEVTALIRESDLVITDYSSVYIDALYLNKPVLGFTYDYEHFRDQQDGLLYDHDIIFPGPAVNNMSSLLVDMDNELSKNEQVNSTPYKIARKFFFDYRDEHNSQRVMDNIFRILSK